MSDITYKEAVLMQIEVALGLIFSLDDVAGFLGQVA
jgi:hypothetical protein